MHDKYNPLAESALFEVYRGENQEEAFNGVLKNISRNYDLISYLFFVKSPNRFLPVRTTHFEKSFKAIGVEYELSGRCSWENYQGFLNIVQEVQRRISPMLKGILRENELRLIDAHSFLWVIQTEEFETWDPDVEALKYIEQRTESYQQSLIEGNGGVAERLIEQFNRSSKVSKATKLRAKGICQLCGNPAPYVDKK